MERFSNFGRENVSSLFSESAFELESSESGDMKVAEQQSGFNMEVINKLLNQIDTKDNDNDCKDHKSALISFSFPSGFGDGINLSQVINGDKMRDNLFVASTPFSAMTKVKNNIDHENVSQYIKDDGNKSLALEFNGPSPICNKSTTTKHKLIGRKLHLNEPEESFNKSGLLS